MITRRKRTTNKRTGGGAGKRRSLSGRSPAQAAGAAAGRRFTSAHSARERELPLSASRAWARWWRGRSKKGWTWSRYHRQAQAFQSGYCRAAGARNPRLLLLPTEKSVSAIVSVNPGQSIDFAVLNQLARLPLHELLVIVSGMPEPLWEAIRSHPSRPVIVHYREPLGPDVGRAVGAKLAASDILLFADGAAAPVRAEDWILFVHAAARGSDMVLNDASPYGGAFKNRTSSAIVKEFMNYAQRRRDLGTGSLGSCPYALSRRCVERLGPGRLVSPQTAQAMAPLLGLKITAPIHLPRMKGRQDDPAFISLRQEVLFGDCMEALSECSRIGGIRFGHPDSIRKRSMLEEAGLCV